MARSGSANEPIICIIIRPAGVVGSIASLRLRKPAFASLIHSISSAHLAGIAKAGPASRRPALLLYGFDRARAAVPDGSSNLFVANSLATRRLQGGCLRSWDFTTEQSSGTREATRDHRASMGGGGCHGPLVRHH